MNPHEELFHRLLDESSSLLAAPEGAGIAIPDDELHREIIVPLLPAMLADAAIRGHWNEQHATGFVARISRHFENGDPAPRWTPGDFEIHVTASYSAGPDARALADTLLSEKSLREMTAALMNQLLDALWPTLAPAPAAPKPAIEIPTVQIPAAEILTPTTEVPASILPTQTAPEPEPVPALAQLAVSGSELVTGRHVPSRALVRALCRKVSSSSIQRGFITKRASVHAGAAIVARRIFQRATAMLKKKRR